MFQNIPDPNIDWESIRYNRVSDEIRPEKGYRYCRICKQKMAINSYNFYRNCKTADGYSYDCRNCITYKRKNKEF